MEIILGFFCLSFVVFAVVFIRLFKRSNSDRVIIFTELIECRHAINTLNNDLCAYVHNDIDAKRATRPLSVEESALWEKTREVMRQYQIEKKNYEALVAR
jgi:hypothetical protein